MNIDNDKNIKDVGRPEASGHMETPTGTKKIESFRDVDNEKELNKDEKKTKQPVVENNSDEDSGDNAAVEESDDESDHN